MPLTIISAIPEKEYPSLNECASQAKMESRFAVLRQMVFSNEYYNGTEIEQLIKNIKTNRKNILKNENSTTRDKIALLSLLCGKKIYKLTWKAYTKMR